MSDVESDEEVLEEVENSDDEEDVELTIKEQVSGLANSVVRTKKIIEIPDDQRRTSDYITKTELVEIIGTRAALIERGAPAYTQIGDLKNPIHIAVKELLEGQNPQKIRRVVRETDTEKFVEVWEVRNMIANLENYIEIVPEKMFEKIQESINSLSNTDKKNKPAVTKKGGYEKSYMPPIIYWYNGTQKDRYNFILEDFNSKLQALVDMDYSNVGTNLDDNMALLDNKSEYEKKLGSGGINKDVCYISVNSEYKYITRLLSTIAISNCSELYVNIKNTNILTLCALQMIKYYYKDVKFKIFQDNNFTMYIVAKDRNNVHHFYTHSIINLIDLPEVNSIFLISDLIKL